MFLMWFKQFADRCAKWLQIEREMAAAATKILISIGIVTHVNELIFANKNKEKENKERAPYTCSHVITTNANANAKNELDFAE